MEASKAEYQRGEFLTKLPPVPENEFCVFGTVSSETTIQQCHSIAQVYAHPEHADALEAVYAETTRLAASEPGIIYYCLSRDGDDPTVFHFFERYTGRQAFEDHNAQPIIRKLMKDQLIKGVKAKFVEAIRPAGS
jgi:quinol monooxygenase YgiN